MIEGEPMDTILFVTLTEVISSTLDKNPIKYHGTTP
jgi:hypothetical protein